MENLLHVFLAEFTELTAADRAAVAEQLTVRRFPKGHLLLTSGAVADRCFYLLEGCIRQYQLQDGVEKTTNFFTERQAVVSFASYLHQKPVNHYWECLEDCLLIEGDLKAEADMYEQFPPLQLITRAMMAEDLGQIQEERAAFITSTPKQRYLHLLERRPGLIHRVPQHQVASYLGVTPESLSRIRRRIRAEEKQRAE
jgi:CRP-like cAMP-binding protein